MARQNGENDPIKNCALEICCLEFEDAVQAASKIAYERLEKGREGINPRDCYRVVHALMCDFELAERGTLTAFKKSIVRVHEARE